MPNTKSARKSLRVGIRRNAENKKIKLDIRQAVKKASLENLGEVYKILDKAAKNNVIHKNKAARLKSRISASVNREEVKETVKKSTTKTPAKKTIKKTTVKKTTAKKTSKKKTS